jgi:hypothetical protein
MLHVVSLSILGIWYASIAAQAGAAIVLARRGLAFRYRMLWLMLLVEVAGSLWGVLTLQIRGAHSYRAAWTLFQALDVGLWGALVAEAFYLQARHFRRISGFATMLAAAIVATAVIACVSTAGIGVAFWPVWFHSVALWMRYYTTGLFAVLALSVVFFRVFGGAMRANVERHVLILGLLLSSGVIGFAIPIATGGRSAAVNMIAQVVPTVFTFICSMLWALTLTIEGEAFVAPPPMSRQELESLIREDRERARHGWA